MRGKTMTTMDAMTGQTTMTDPLTTPAPTPRTIPAALRVAMKNAPQVGYEIVTPEQAQTWLDTLNTTNRTMVKARVFAVADDIERGQFYPTHQGIAFGTDGSLYDGQHRLAAIVRAGVPVVILVVRGLTPETRAVIDTGRARRVSDNLTVMGGDRMAFKVPVANVIAGLETIGSAKTLSVLAAGAVLARYAEDIEWGAETFALKSRLTRADVVGAIIYARALNPAGVAEFAALYLTGENLTAGDPALTLREGVHSGKIGSGGGAVRRANAIKTLRAVDARLSGEKLTRLQAERESGVFLAKINKRLGRGQGTL